MGRPTIMFIAATAIALSACSSPASSDSTLEATSSTVAPVLDGALDCTSPSRWSHTAEFAKNATGPMNANQALEEALFPYGMAFDGRPLITGGSASLVVGDREIVIATAVALAKGWGITKIEGCDGYESPPGVPPLKLDCDDPQIEQMDSGPVEDGWAAARDIMSAQPDEYVVEPRPGTYAVVGANGSRSMAIGVWNAGEWTLDHTETCS